MIVAAVALLVIPGIGFRMPASPRQWIYLIFLGVCGFVMQFLLTAGLAYERSSRATNMVYTQMLFALAFDKLVWNTTPGLLSVLGSSLILGSALYMAVISNNRKGKSVEDGKGDEEVALVACEADGYDNVGDQIRNSFQEVHGMQLRTLKGKKIST